MCVKEQNRQEKESARETTREKERKARIHGKKTRKEENKKGNLQGKRIDERKHKLQGDCKGCKGKNGHRKRVRNLHVSNSKMSKVHVWHLCNADAAIV